MNSNEFENWLRQQDDDIPYQANDTGWQQLHASLQQDKNTSKRMSFPIPYRIAAAVLLTTGITSYIYFTSGEHPVPPVALQSHTLHEYKEKQAHISLPDSPVLHTMAPLSGEWKASNHTITPVPSPATRDSGMITNPYSSHPEPHIAQKDPEPAMHPDEKTTYITLPSHLLPPPATTSPEHGLAVSLQTGVQQLGGMQYQMGVSRRIALSQDFFLDGSITIASSAVSYSEQHQFSSATVSPGDITSGVNNVKITTTQVSATYKQPVYALGIAPSLGFHITPKWSLSGGTYLNRNINRTIALQPQTDNLSRTLINESEITTSYRAAGWDWGILAGTEYRVHQRLKVQVGYRLGMTDFLLMNKSVRNTGLNLGVRYNLSK